MQNHMEMKHIHPQVTDDSWGIIPFMLSVSDPEKAAKQFHEKYSHGGGWRPQDSFTMSKDGMTLMHPGDHNLVALSEIKFRDETIRLFDYSWVAVIQEDGSYEISRMD